MKTPEGVLEILSHWAEQKRAALRYHEVLSTDDQRLLASFAWLEMQPVAEQQQFASVVAQIEALQIRNLGVISAFDITCELCRQACR